MGFEIERKFLVDASLWDIAEKPSPQSLNQGYITNDPAKTVRVRATNTEGFITIKGKSIGIGRAEYEYSIPLHEAQELLEGFTQNNIEKLRYTLDYEGKIWEVDVFLGDNQGLIVAEIELLSEDETFLKPSWISTEVTNDVRYYNARLSTNPYKNWGK